MPRRHLAGQEDARRQISPQFNLTTARRPSLFLAKGSNGSRNRKKEFPDIEANLVDQPQIACLCDRATSNHSAALLTTDLSLPDFRLSTIFVIHRSGFFRRFNQYPVPAPRGVLVRWDTRADRSRRSDLLASLPYGAREIEDAPTYCHVLDLAKGNHDGMPLRRGKELRDLQRPA